MGTGETVLKSRPGWAWLGLTVAGTSVPVALAAGLGYQAGWWPYGTGFRVLMLAAALGAFGAVLSLAAALANWGLHRGASACAVAGLAIGLAATFVPLQWKLASARLPQIHDISTDTEDPPQFVAVTALRASGDHPTTYEGASLAIKQRAAYPDIRPLHTRQDRQHVLQAARQTAIDMGMRVVDMSEAQGRLEAVDRTLLFGFRDDLVVRVREGPAGTRVDARSMSRLGRSDLGTNAKRLRGFFSRLRARLPD